MIEAHGLCFHLVASHSAAVSTGRPAFILEYVRLRVVGQSFMLHQIRKMIGKAIGRYHVGYRPLPYRL